MLTCPPVSIVFWLGPHGFDRGEGGHHPYVATVKVHQLPATDQVIRQGLLVEEGEVVVLTEGAPTRPSSCP